MSCAYYVYMATCFFSEKKASLESKYTFLCEQNTYAVTRCGYLKTIHSIPPISANSLSRQHRTLSIFDDSFASFLSSDHENANLFLGF